MPIRNPFGRRPGNVVVNDENLRPDNLNAPGFERVTVGSKASSVLSIRSTKGSDNGEYKMSGMYCHRSITCLLCYIPSRLICARRTANRESSIAGHSDQCTITSTY